MNLEILFEQLSMNGYGSYVWSAVGITGVFLISQYVSVLRKNKKLSYLVKLS